jgi:uncharacterized membrane protein YfcA
MSFSALIAAVSFLEGAIAAVTGFGIGSVLTPVLQTRYDIRLAVAAVSIPHVIATAVRFWKLRHDVDMRVLKTFGVMSAVGGLTGAILQRSAPVSALTLVFASLLTFVGIAELTGLSARMRLGRRTGWIAGVLSGALGGLVGNQGGIRSAGLLGYDLAPIRFVATATAAGLIVDGARVPVYVATQAAELRPLTQLLMIASVGAVVGTFVGSRVIKAMEPPTFRKVVGALILLLGVYMFTRIGTA